MKQLTLSAADLTRLETALRTLMSPLEYVDATEWRRNVTESVRVLMGTDSATLIMHDPGEPLLIADGDYTPGTLKEYAEHWYHQIVGDALRIERGLAVWAREEVWPLKAVRRTAYFHDFCVPNANQDSAGAAVRLSASEEVTLYINSARAGRFAPEGREIALLRLLHPALEAGAKAARAFGPHRSDWRTLDAIAVPVAIFDRIGRLLHATPRYSTIIADPTAGAAVRNAADQLARDVGRWPSRSRRTEPAPPASRAIPTPAGTYRVHATIVEQPILGQPALCLVSVTPPPAHTTRADLIRRFRLTPREAEVALLVAQGQRNRDIANALQTSVHTVRRQVEQVLTKLDLHSRAAVAARIA